MTSTTPTRPLPQTRVPYTVPYINPRDLRELDLYLMRKGCISTDLKPVPGAKVPMVAEFKADLASDGITSMYAVRERIRRQHEREGLGSALRQFFMARYGLEVHYQRPGARSRKAPEVVER